MMPYSIGELADRAGVTTRTIRFYVSEGVLTPPETSGRFATYGDAHLARLRLIARLKDAYLPLHAIRERLAGLTDEEVLQLAEEGAEDARPSDPWPPAEVGEARSSASDYVRRVLAGAALGGQALPPSSGATTKAGAREHWERRELAPGIELHIRLPLSPSRRECVRDIETYVRSSLSRWS